MTDHLDTLLNALIDEKRSILLTGSAGTGKTYHTNLLTKRLIEDGYNVAITATTGLASQLVGGSTLHAFLRLPIIRSLNVNNYPKKSSIVDYINIGNLERIVNLDFLFIDEISMLNDMMFDLAHWILKYVTTRYAMINHHLRDLMSTPMEFLDSLHTELMKLPSVNINNMMKFDSQFRHLEATMRGVGECDDGDSSPCDGSDFELVDLEGSLLALNNMLDEVQKSLRRAPKVDRIQFELFRLCVSDILRCLRDPSNMITEKNRWDERLKLSRSSFTGYIRLVMVGDLLQLPPVILKNEVGLINYIIYSPEFTSENVKRFVLTKNMRQENEEFSNVLSEIRSSSITDEVKKMLENMRINQNESRDDYIELMNSNKDVEQKNFVEVSKLNTREKVYWSQNYEIITLNQRDILEGRDPRISYDDSGSSLIYRQDASSKPIKIEMGPIVHEWKTDQDADIDCLTHPTYQRSLDSYRICIPPQLSSIPRTISNDFMTTHKMSLKESAKVVVLKNIPDLQVSNGTQGTIVELHEGRVDIKTLDGRIVGIRKEKFTIAEENSIFVRKQIPLRLAYAITIHKSQGMTLDQGIVRVDRDNLWHKSPGMAYVALSRFKDIERVKIRGSIFYPGIVCNPVVKKFYEGKSITREVNHYNKLKYSNLGLDIPVRKTIKGKVEVIMQENQNRISSMTAEEYDPSDM